MIRFLGELWALPWSLVGYVLALATGCERIRDGDTFFWLAPKDSALWARWMIWSGFEAITIGTVTICAGWPSSTLLDHEARHRRQARILGPFYVPAYILGCVVGWMRGDWYERNPLEEDARRE